MIVLQGYWFDGKTSARISAEMQVDDSAILRVIDSLHKNILISCDFSNTSQDSNVRISSRIANTPRYVYFPSGEKFETQDNLQLDQLLRRYRPSLFNTLAYQLESHIYSVCITLVAVIFLSWAGVKYGLPAASKMIAYRLPQQVMNAASSETLTLLDQTHLKPTQLSQDVQNRLLQHFDSALKESANFHVHVLFRAGGDFGANAFALPDGSIIFTDQMIMLAKNDDELLAVLAHEIGHVKYRHALRSAIQGTSLGFLASMLTGDLSAVSGVITALPVFLTTMSYSRDFEREADQNALDYLSAHQIDSMSFVTLMERVAYEDYCNRLLKLKSESQDVKDNESLATENESPEDLTDEKKAERKAQCDALIEKHKSEKSTFMDYFSTHPATEERLEKFKQAH